MDDSGVLSVNQFDLADIDPRDAATLIATASDVALVIDGQGVIRDVSISREESAIEGSADWVGRHWLETVTVESRLGVGTTFRLYFPLVASAPVAAPAARPEAPRGGGQHVMLVDDELLVLSVAKPMLRRLGYRTTVFDRSRAALEAYEKAPQDFDLVVSDLTMPELTGIELVQRMRALRPEQPVLIMTGYMRTADIESVRTSGVANFLSKPFTLVSLGEGIRLALQGQPSPPAT